MTSQAEEHHRTRPMGKDRACNKLTFPLGPWGSPRKKQEMRVLMCIELSHVLGTVRSSRPENNLARYECPVSQD